MAASGVSRRRTRKNVSAAFLEQCDYIVQCARKLYEEQGVRKTSLADVAREASMTRELIYYYFDGKADLTEGVLDSYVQDAIESTRLLCDTWEAEEVPLTRQQREALVSDVVAAIRRYAFTQTGTRRPMFMVVQEMQAEDELVLRVSDQIARELQNRGLTERFQECGPHIEQQYLSGFLRLLLFGIVGIMATSPAQNDDAIVKLLLVASGLSR